MERIISGHNSADVIVEMKVSQSIHSPDSYPTSSTSELTGRREVFFLLPLATRSPPLHSHELLCAMMDIETYYSNSDTASPWSDGFLYALQ
jgi:hypothetical protein